MATLLRVSAISAFCQPITHTHSITSCLVAIVHTKPVMAILVPELVVIATSLSTLGLPCNTWFLQLIRAHNPSGISISSAVFAQITAEYHYTLQWDAPFPLKIVPSYGGIWTPSNTWFLGPTRVINPNGILIGAAVFAWLTSMTDGLTDSPRYSIGNSRPYLHT